MLEKITKLFSFCKHFSSIPGSYNVTQCFLLKSFAFPNFGKLEYPITLTYLEITQLMPYRNRARKKKWIPACPWASSHHILLAKGHFSLILVNDFVRGWTAWTLACLLGKYALKVTCPASKAACPGLLDGKFFLALRRGFNKQQRPTKLVDYFAHRSRLLLSPKEEITSVYNVVNNKYTIKSECNRLGPQVLHCALVAQKLYFSQIFNVLVQVYTEFFIHVQM